MCIHICRQNHPELSYFRGFRYAHRGLYDVSIGIPENSIPAFQRAVDYGFGAELDVHLTADGQLVVVHDSDIFRLCGVHKIVEELTVEELQSYPILDTACRIPLFQEVLKVFEGKTPLIVELKTYQGNASALTKAACEMMDNFTIRYNMESFDPAVVFWLRCHRPEICRGQLSCDYSKEPAPHKPIREYLLTNLCFNLFTYPDYIAYDCNDRHNHALRLCRKLYHVQEVSWTVRNLEMLNEVESEGCISIFERFIP